MDEPVADTCAGILDGHIVLSRSLAERTHYPAIDVLQSHLPAGGQGHGPAHARGLRRASGACWPCTGTPRT